MRIRGTSLAERRDEDWQREWHVGALSEDREIVSAPRMSRERAYGILVGLSPVKRGGWMDKDRASSAFPVVVDGEELLVTCVWEPNLVKKGDVEVTVQGLGGASEHGGRASAKKFLIHGEFKGGIVEPELAKVLEALRNLPEFDLGTPEFVSENEPWEKVKQAAVFKNGMPYEPESLKRAAYVYEVAARFTDAMDFLIRKILRESDQTASHFRQKTVNEFAVPVVIDGESVEIVGSILCERRPLEGYSEINGTVGIKGRETLKFSSLNGPTQPNFVEESAGFPYQDREDVVKWVEVYRDEQLVGGVNNFGKTRLYGEPLQHFLNEGSRIGETLGVVGGMTAVLEKLRAVFEGEVGGVREGVRRGLGRN